MAVASGPRAMWSIDKGRLQVPKNITWPMDAPYNPVPGDPDGEYGQVIVMGTCFDPNDLYDTLRKAERYKTLYFDCYWDREKWEPDKTQTMALWPDVWPVGRLNAMRYVLHKLPYANKDTARIGNLDPLIVGRANVVYERGEQQGVPIL